MKSKQKKGESYNLFRFNEHKKFKRTIINLNLENLHTQCKRKINHFYRKYTHAFSILSYPSTFSLVARRHSTTKRQNKKENKKEKYKEKGKYSDELLCQKH